MRILRQKKNLKEPNAVGSFVTNEGNGNLKELQLRENDKKASKIVVAKGISLFGVDGQDIDIYVDGKLVEQDKIGTINSENIERIEINKGDTRKSIHVFTKKQ